MIGVLMKYITLCITVPFIAKLDIHSDTKVRIKWKKPRNLIITKLFLKLSKGTYVMNEVIHCEIHNFGFNKYERK